MFSLWSACAGVELRLLDQGPHQEFIRTNESCRALREMYRRGRGRGGVARDAAPCMGAGGAGAAHRAGGLKGLGLLRRAERAAERLETQVGAFVAASLGVELRGLGVPR